MRILEDLTLDANTSSVLTIGDSGSGKSTIVERALRTLSAEVGRDTYLIDVHNTGNYAHCTKVHNVSETFLTTLIKEIGIRKVRRTRGKFVGDPIYIIIDGFQALKDPGVVPYFINEIQGLNVFLWAITSGSLPISDEIKNKFTTFIVLKCSKTTSMSILGTTVASDINEKFGNIWVLNKRGDIHHYREVLQCN